MVVIYKEEDDVDNIGWMQPPGEFVRMAEDERDGEEVTWAEIHARAWELQAAWEAM